MPSTTTNAPGYWRLGTGSFSESVSVMVRVSGVTVPMFGQTCCQSDIISRNAGRECEKSVTTAERGMLGLFDGLYVGVRRKGASVKWLLTFRSNLSLSRGTKYGCGSLILATRLVGTRGTRRRRAWGRRLRG